MAQRKCHIRYCLVISNFTITEKSVSVELAPVYVPLSISSCSLSPLSFSGLIIFSDQLLISIAFSRLK